MSKLPPLTQEPLQHVGAVPDADYPLRILRAHRHNADCRWEHRGEGPEPAIMTAMNEHCRRRARILDAAIAILEQNRRTIEEADDG